MVVQDGYLAPEARRQLPAAVTVVDGVSGAFDEENASWEQLSYLNINDSISQLTAIVKKCEATAVIVDGMQTCMALHGVSGAMDWMEGAAAIEGMLLYFHAFPLLIEYLARFQACNLLESGY